MTAFEWPVVDPRGQSTDSLVRLLNLRLGKLARAVGGKQDELATVVRADKMPGRDWGEKVSAALARLPSGGGVIDARNLDGSQALSNTLTIATPNVTVLFGPMILLMGTHGIRIAAGTHGVGLVGVSPWGAPLGGGSPAGSNLVYTGTANAVQVGDTSADTFDFLMSDVAVNISSAGSAATAWNVFRTIGLEFVRPRVIMTTGVSTQNGIVLDGTNNYCGSGVIHNPFIVNGFRGIYGTGSGVHGMNAVLIQGGTIAGAGIASSQGIRIAAGDSNTVTGTDLEAWEYGFYTERGYNRIAGRFENNVTDVFLGVGSNHNRVEAVSGSALGVIVVTDSGTKNSVTDPETVRTTLSGRGEFEDALLVNVGSAGLKVGGAVDGGVGTIFGNATGQLAHAADSHRFFSKNASAEWAQVTAAGLILKTPGTGLLVAEGTDATLGVATLVAGTVTVPTAKVTATSRILLTVQSVGGTPGLLAIGTVTPGASFTITSSNVADTSIVAWLIVEPA